MGQWPAKMAGWPLAPGHTPQQGEEGLKGVTGRFRKASIASPGSMHDTGCMGLVHWDDPEGWYGEEGGFRMGKTCIPVVDSFQYLAKPIQYFKVEK